MRPRFIIAAAWLAFVLVWLVAAPWSRRTVERESLASRLTYSAPLIVSIVLLFPRARFAWLPFLGMRLFRQNAVSAYVGAALTAIGVGWAIWARAHLGRMWSGAITLKEDHHIVKSGPYAITRHPIYTGALFALLGTALASDTVRAALGLALSCIAFTLKLSREDALLARTFGQEFDAYKRRVKALVPFVW